MKRKITIPPALVPLSDAELAQIFNCSRQAIIFARRRANLQCVKCARPVTPGSQFCTTHKVQARSYMRRRNRRIHGFNPQKPGGRGRPPLTKATEEK